jgi:hypothetical protein
VRKFLTVTLATAAVALAAAVLAPWRALDAAAPAAADDPLNHRAIVRPMPSALAQRGQANADADAPVLLKNWNFTDVDISDAF